MIGPRNEFVLMGAKRTVADNIQRSAIFQISRLNRIIDSQDAEIDFLHLALDAKVGEASMLAIERNGYRDDLQDCIKQSAKNQGWATVGKVATIAVSVGIAAVVTIAVIDATNR